jgi:hypothetical protein
MSQLFLAAADQLLTVGPRWLYVDPALQLEPWPGVTYNDPHAADFLAAVPTITDPARQQAVHKFCTLYKVCGAWDYETAIWLVVGGTATAHSLNVKNLNQYQLTFYNSPVHSASGIEWNGINTWADTHLVPATALTMAGGASLQWLTNTAGASGLNNYDLGAVSAGDQNLFGASRNTSGGGGIPDALYGKAYQTDAFKPDLPTPGVGLHGVFRSPLGGGTSAEQMVTLTRNGQVVLPNGQDNGGSLPTEALALGVVKVPGGAFGHTDRRGAFYSVGAVPQALQAQAAALILELKTVFGQV